MAQSQLADLRYLLVKSLAGIPCLDRAHCCALLNHPSHGNLGDHLIWAAQLHYLEQVRQLPVRYVASPDLCSHRKLESAVGDQPIVLSGGGQVGDQWPRLQDFIERVVDRYRRNPIVIFPQSLYFQDRSRLQRAASILQRHPDLTLVLRDQVSYQFAQSHFSGCHLLLSSDMAFALPIDELFPAGQIGRLSHPRRPWLALCRGDREASSTPWLPSLAPWRSLLECTDWLPLERHWIWGDRRLPLSRHVATGVRELLQRRLLMPHGALVRHHWLRGLPPEMQQMAQSSSLNRLSLGMVHEACQQIAGRQLVITDRLHAVILASLLGVPSLAIDNHTGKIHSFLDTWAPWLPQAEAVTADQLPPRLEQIAGACSERAIPL